MRVAATIMRRPDPSKEKFEPATLRMTALEIPH